MIMGMEWSHWFLLRTPNLTRSLTLVCLNNITYVNRKFRQGSVITLPNKSQGKQWLKSPSKIREMTTR